jgi:hypothetical protein
MNFLTLRQLLVRAGEPLDPDRGTDCGVSLSRTENVATSRSLDGKCSGAIAALELGQYHPVTVLLRVVSCRWPRTVGP